MRKLLLIGLAVCGLLALNTSPLFGLAAGITSDPDTTWNVKIDWNTNILKIGDYWQGASGMMLDSVRVDSGDAAARHIDTCILMDQIPADGWEYFSAWVNMTVKSDSIGTIATLLDTCRAVFQTSFDGANWFDLRNAAVEDTVLIATTTVATEGALARTASAPAGLFGKYFRVLIYYDLAVGVQTGSGCQDWWPVTFKFGYSLWNTYK